MYKHSGEVRLTAGRSAGKSTAGGRRLEYPQVHKKSASEISTERGNSYLI